MTSGSGTGNRRWRLGLLYFVALLVLYFAIPVQTDLPPARLALNVLLTFVAVSAIAWVVVRELVRPSPPGESPLTGFRLLLLLEIVLILLALVYYGLAVNLPGEMVGISTRIDALYFTATTMGTVGFGDIHAAGQIGRSVVLVALLFDAAFIAAVARLLNARLAGRRGDTGERDESDGLAGR